MQIRTATIDSRRIAYTDETIFLVQIGKNRGAYRTRIVIKGDLHQAAHYYKSINVGLGYKKRLYMPNAKRPTLARMVT